MRELRPGLPEPVIVLTAPWHERDTQSFVESLGAPVYAPPPDTAQDLMHKCGITAEQAGDGSPDLVWPRVGGGEAHWYGGGDRLPIGVEAFAGREHNAWCSGSTASEPWSSATRSSTSERVQGSGGRRGSDGPSRQ